MRKTLVVASREYQAAVRTKTFLISLLIMPLMMGGSVAMQVIFKDKVDITDKKFVVVDRANRPEIAAAIKLGVEVYNKVAINDPETGHQVKPRFVVEVREGAKNGTKVNDERVKLSDDVRDGNLFGFMEILPASAKQREAGNEVVLRYQSNNVMHQEFPVLAEKAAETFIRTQIQSDIKLPPERVKTLLDPVGMESKGLSKRSESGDVAEPTEQSRVAAFFIPFGMMMLMFMVVLMTATPLMQGVVEEKMQRIAEVLLGSVRPFELMVGKLIGMTGVSLTIGLVYLGGAYWAAAHFGATESLTVDLILWFVFFQILAGLMFGSLFIAVGAACTELKETQTMLWPVMLLACLPMFAMGNVLREPNGPVARTLSFFPFATPTLMIARQALPPGLPLWEPVVGALLVLATTTFCIWAAGRIFRVGILMQGKGAKFGEMIKWVFRG